MNLQLLEPAIATLISGARHSRAWRSARLVIVLIFLLSTSTWAVDPGRHISQYEHTAWRVQDGIEVGTAITQTPDGYLWFGTPSGLLRFDGVKFVPYDLPPITPALRGFNYLLGARDGSLWIGTQIGLARLKDGKLRWYSDPAQHSGISVILEDPEGTIWLTRYRVPRGEGPLCRVQGNGLHCYGESDGIPVKYGIGLARDSEGNLWFGSSALCRWQPGSASTYLNYVSNRRGSGEGVIDVAAGRSGTIWATTEAAGADMGVLSSSGGKWATYIVPGFDGSKVGSDTLFMDREQSLWIGTIRNGLYRVHGGRGEHYGTADGLSGNDINLIYEDREGNVWVLTDGGIDMFRDTSVLTYSAREGLSGASILSVLGLRDGSLWIGNGRVIDIFKDGHHSVLPAKGAFDENVTALFQESKGLVWVGRGNELFAYEHGRFQEFKRPDGSKLEEGKIVAITEDTKGNIWVLTEHHHVFRVENGSAVQVLTASSDNRLSGGLAPDHHGGIWIASRNDTLTYYKDGGIRTISMNRSDSSFSVLEITVDSDDALLVATTDGLFRWDNQHWQVLDSHNGLPGNIVLSVLRDNDGAVWVRCQKGLVRISESEFDKWRHQSISTPGMEVFDRFDGAQSGRASLMIQPPATKTSDGRLWFVAGTVVQMIDPRQTFQNRILPPIHIEKVIADRKEYGLGKATELPALTRDVQIDYTALSLAVPEKVFFRYQLEGHDGAWQEAGTRRQAFYNDLRPGQYRFRVIACNNDGVWNEAGAVLNFSIRPAYYQTTWFRVLCVATFLLLLWVAYKFRVRQLERRLKLSEENSRLYGELRQRDAESERLRQELADLARLNRVSTMGELTASLAHEIKQPIGAAVTNAEACARLLDRDQPDMPEAREAALEMAKDARRAAHIIDRVRSLYRKTSSEFEAVDVNEVIEEMALMLQNEADRHSVTIRTELAENLPRTMADRVQLQQVLMNLMLNGIEAMRDTSGELSIQSQLAEDGQLLVSVIDTGVGLPTDDVERIFNAFFTTKSEGTGLGLAITRSIVESHCGRIWVTPNPGRGTSFHFTLPSRAPVPAPTSSNPYCVH